MNITLLNKRTIILLGTGLLAFASCDADLDGAKEQDNGSDVYADSDPAGDLDSDSDNDADTDTDTDTDADSDSDVADDPCAARTTRIGPTLCGDNGLGRLEQTLEGDTWTDQEVCVENQNVGGPCTCEGEACRFNQFGVKLELPYRGNIVGCGDLPDDWPGAAKACIRSDNNQPDYPLYFAGGYCSLMAIKCQGNALACGLVPKAGMNYAAFTSCPAGMVMLQGRLVIDIQAINAEIQLSLKACMKSCECDADCRGPEIDPVHGNTPAQYQCFHKDGIGYCGDLRNDFGVDYTVEQF